MYQLFKYTLILFFLQLTTTVVAQNYTLSYRVLDNEDGLLGSRVISYHEDKLGFVWLSTQHGISRYDGHQFQWFTIINSNLRGVPEEGSEPLVEDDEGYLWSLSAGQIDIINTKTLEIQPLETKVKEALPFKGKISTIRASKDNYIIFKVSGDKWYVYHSSTGFKELDISTSISVSLQIQGDKVWYLDDNKFKAYNYKSKQQLHEFSYDNQPILRVISNYNGEKMLFWRFIVDDVIQIFEYKNNVFEKIAEYKTTNPLKVGLVFLMYLPRSNIFVTNFDVKNQGLTVINLEQQELIPIKNTKDDIFTSANGRWINKQDVIWARSKRSTVLLQIKESHFEQYLPNFSLRGLGVFNNHLFANKYNLNLNNLDKTEILDVKETGSIWGVEQKIKDELWIGTSNSIIKFDTISNTFIKRIPSRLRRPAIWTILKSEEGKLWGGTYLKGLFISNFPQNDSLFQFEQYNEFEELKGIRINHLLEEGKHIWVSTGIGLYLIHKEKGVIKKYNSEASENFQIPANHIHFLYKDPSNTYWLTTSSEGLIRFQVNEDFEITSFKRYTVKDGLSSNTLYCIIEDDDERLWISTLNGLSCLDKNTEQIQVFYKDDGLFELEFNRNSYTKANDGRIFFGSIHGVTAFYPDEIIKTNEYDFPIHISGFYSYKKQNNQLVDQTFKVRQSQKIIIEPSDRFFRLNVAMLDVFNSHKLKYAYKIEGLFDDFQPIEGNTIEVGSLPYGRYTLRVRGQGGDKRFSKQELNLPLIVMRPFYIKWWFLTFALLVIIISIFQFYQWRVRQLEERKRELELLVLERTTQIRMDKAIIEKDKTVIEAQAMQLKELDELKSKFFANISHELRTPLTLILSPLNRYINKSNYNYEDGTMLRMMQQNGQKLLKRINELLDLSRLDANRLEINEAPTFLYPFLKTLLSTFESSINLKDIQLLFKYELDENIQVKLDHDKVEKIVSNYLSNALKFTPKKGEIELHISKKEGKLFISVRDTGIGILPNDLIKIFDRFYQAQSTDVAMQRNGSGIGLSLCRELAKVLNGKVWATSEIGQGSIFYLELPLVETFVVKEETEEENIISTQAIPEIAIISNAQKFRPNILIVEDNPDLRTYLSMILKEEYNVEVVENGKEALKQLAVGSGQLTVGSQQSVLPTANLPAKTRQAGCQLIISDIMMPVMDGIELLTKVKSTKEFQHIPMIMLTARQSLDVKMEALRIGVDDYLTKPFRDEELKARVANLIKNSQNRSVEPLQTVNIVAEVKKSDYIWLSQIEQAILNNIDNLDFKITDLATEMSISYSGLQRKIKKITGLTPKQYERSIKLHQARKLFKSGEVRTVTEVMYQLGFEHLSYFSKIYKQEFGVMPTDELK